MQRFVRALTEEMHSLNSSAQVIWYDSVTTEGKLTWQNELNVHNYPFFELCDGIFLNYNWRVDDEKNSIENSLRTLEEHKVQSRNLDIYFGVDVFGRGTYGGGGFDSCKAFEAVRGRTSMAIFAPGWTHEVKEEGVNFVQREYKFWKLLQSHVTFGSVRWEECNLAFSNGVDKEGCKWSLDYNTEHIMPPVYSLGTGCPFLLSHQLDHAECVADPTIRHKGLAIAKSGKKPWNWMGVQNVVPILLCNVSVGGAESLSVTLTMTSHQEEGRPLKWPDVYARYYFSGDDTPVVEKLECVNVQQEQRQAVYTLSFKHKSASFLDCLAMEATLTCPDFAVLKQCAIQLVTSTRKTDKSM